MSNLLDDLSPSLKRGIQMYTERLNMNEKDRSLFYDILRFTFNEGSIKGKEEYLKEIKINSNESED